MLQQTQVSTVIEYFNRWMGRFPDAATLAAADLDEVLGLWAGLGYYARAKNLHAAAKVIVSDFKGRIPDTVEQLQSLPGIGRYTAGAIASIAFGRKAPVVDGNVRRVLSRLHGENLADSQCWALAEELVESANGRAGDCNQAIMELGATVCTRHGPSCLHCPLSPDCKGLRGGNPQRLPQPKRPPEVKTIRRLAVAIERKQQWLLLKRPESGLWAGMWEFPQLVPERSVSIEGLVQQKFGLEVELGGRFAAFSHTLTHRNVKFECYHAHATSGRLRRNGYQRHRWIRANAMGTMPMAAYGDKMVKIVQDTLFNNR